jgi:hypothetical protein
MKAKEYSYPHDAMLARHLSQYSEEMNAQEWRATRRGLHYANYLADGDLADALATVEEGTVLGQWIWMAVRDDDLETAASRIQSVMEKAALLYANSTTDHEELLLQESHKAERALAQANRMGRVPPGYDD